MIMKQPDQGSFAHTVQTIKNERKVVFTIVNNLGTLFLKKKATENSFSILLDNKGCTFLNAEYFTCIDDAVLHAPCCGVLYTLLYPNANKRSKYVPCIKFSFKEYTSCSPKPYKNSHT